MSDLPMKMDPEHFRALIIEIIEGNPYAIRPLLSISAIEFTETIPTLAVTCSSHPVLKVNLGFIGRICQNDFEAKTLVVHEFLHILLRHTSRSSFVTPAEQLAADAVINAIIHRQVGPKASAVMARYYAGETGLMRLLRPPRPEEIAEWETREKDALECAWVGLYSGKLVFDDIRELAETLEAAGCRIDISLLIGWHAEGAPGTLGEEAAAAMDRILRSMNGGGLWRRNPGCGIGAEFGALVVKPEDLQRRN